MSEAETRQARIRVTVKPRSSRKEVRVESGGLVVRVTAAPVEGKANEMCLDLVADWLGVARSRLAVVSGGRSREKVIGIRGLDQVEVDRRLRLGTVE